MSNSSEVPSIVTKPHDWDKVLSAAMFRSLGQTQETAAELAGVSPRTIYSWEHSSFWQDALDEVQDRWLQGCTTAARATLLQGLGEDPRLALDYLSRVDRRLHPKSELGGIGGGPVGFDVVHHSEEPGGDE